MALFVVTNLAILVVLGLVWSALSYFGVLESFGLSGDGLGPLLIMALLFGFGGSIISLLLSKTMAKRSTGARVITSPQNETEAWLLQTVNTQARQLGLDMPEVAVFDSPSPNAFATGARRNAALVAVSTGLLGAMERSEVEAVLGHEMSHVANGDMVTLTLVQGVVNTFVILLARVIGGTVDRTLFRNQRGRGPGYYIATIVAEVVLGIGATMIVMAFSRYREFRADAGGAELTTKDSMIGALKALGGAHDEPLPQEVAAFGVRGGAFGGLRKLFSSHPPIEKRIERLAARG